MPRISVLSAATLAVTLTACNKAPAPPAAPSAPAAASAAAAPTAPGSTAVTYQCSTPQKSRDIFIRFDSKDGSVAMGATKDDMKDAALAVRFDNSGQASWTSTLPNGTDTNTFNKNTGEWIWAEQTSTGQTIDSATYSCKPL